MLNPVKGFDEDACEYQKQAGTEPADNLGVNWMMVPMASDLPVGINPQTTDDAGNCADHQHEVRQAEIHAVHLLCSLVKIIDAGWVLCVSLKNEGKKKDSECCL